MLPLTCSVLRVLPNDRLLESGYRPQHRGENLLPFHVLSPHGGMDNHHSSPNKRAVRVRRTLLRLTLRLQGASAGAPQPHG